MACYSCVSKNNKAAIRVTDTDRREGEHMMNTVLLNEEMSLTIPEGFAEITAAEVQEMTACKGQAPMWNIMNRDAHILISASWVKTGWIVSHLLNAKDMVKSIRSRYKAKEASAFGGTYSDINETTMDGQKAYSYTCSYRGRTKEGEMLDMIRETVVVKIGKVFYVFQSVCRDELKEEGIASFHEVYDSVQFAAVA